MAFGFKFFLDGKQFFDLFEIIFIAFYKAFNREIVKNSEKLHFLANLFNTNLIIFKFYQPNLRSYYCSSEKSIVQW